VIQSVGVLIGSPLFIAGKLSWSFGRRIMQPLVFGHAMPAFAAELEASLRDDGHNELATQVAALPITERCRCGDDFCATFYTAEIPSGAYGAGHSNVIVSSQKGMIFLDVVNDGIKCIEVLYRPDVQKTLFEILP
jgi:hypothetical protein